jgi:hypothetical protein
MRTEDGGFQTGARIEVVTTMAGQWRGHGSPVQPGALLGCEQVSPFRMISQAGAGSYPPPPFACVLGAAAGGRG